MPRVTKVTPEDQEPADNQTETEDTGSTEGSGETTEQDAPVSQEARGGSFISLGGGEVAPRTED